MNATEIIEQIKTLSLEERRAVLKFLNEDLKEESSEKRAEDREMLRRLSGVFGRKSGT